MPFRFYSESDYFRSVHGTFKRRIPCGTLFLLVVNVHTFSTYRFTNPCKETICLRIQHFWRQLIWRMFYWYNFLNSCFSKRQRCNYYSFFWGEVFVCFFRLFAFWWHPLNNTRVSKLFEKLYKYCTLSAQNIQFSFLLPIKKLVLDINIPFICDYQLTIEIRLLSSWI